MNERILNVKVGEPLEASLARAAGTMEALERGGTLEPYFGVGFGDIGQLFAVFTPRRWNLLAAMREGGPMSIAELARRLKHDYKNVHGDVEKFAAWQAVEMDEQGRIFAPYSGIVGMSTCRRDERRRWWFLESCLYRQPTVSVML